MKSFRRKDSSDEPPGLGRNRPPDFRGEKLSCLAHDPPSRRSGGVMAPIGNHSFRTTGITAYLANGGALEHAQSMAAHESPRMTKLYHRTTSLTVSVLA